MKILYSALLNYLINSRVRVKMLIKKRIFNSEEILQLCSLLLGLSVL